MQKILCEKNINLLLYSKNCEKCYDIYGKKKIY